MSLTIELPQDIERRLREQTSNLDVELKEALGVEMFRRGKLTHYELSQVLGLDRFETDRYLKQHNIYDGSLMSSEIDADRTAVADALRQGGTKDDSRR